MDFYIGKFHVWLSYFIFARTKHNLSMQTGDLHIVKIGWLRISWIRRP